MSTITAVVKDGVAALAADTLQPDSDLKRSTVYLAEFPKILQLGNSSIAIAGPASVQDVLAHYFATAGDIDLQSVQGIFGTWLRLHEALRDRYYLNGANDESVFEPSQFEVLIANETGAYTVSPYRAVRKVIRFKAAGAGKQIAMGAMYAWYEDDMRTAEEIARLGVEAAAEFEDSTGLPIDSKSVMLTTTPNSQGA